MGDSDYKMSRKGRSDNSKSPHKAKYRKWLISWVSEVILRVEVYKVLNQTKEKNPRSFFEGLGWKEISNFSDESEKETEK